MFPLPSLTFPLTVNVNRQPKDDRNQPPTPGVAPPVLQPAISSQMSYAFDPALILMLIAIVMLSSAVVVYAARH